MCPCRSLGWCGNWPRALASGRQRGLYIYEMLPARHYRPINPRSTIALAGIALGDRIGPYEILALEGSGGTGDVFRAKDTRLNRTVAI